MNFNQIIQKLDEIKILVQNLKELELNLDYLIEDDANHPERIQLLIDNLNKGSLIVDSAFFQKAWDNYCNDKCSLDVLEILIKYFDDIFPVEENMYKLLASETINDKYKKADFILEHIIFDEVELIINMYADMKLNIVDDDIKFLIGSYSSDERLEICTAVIKCDKLSNDFKTKFVEIILKNQLVNFADIIKSLKNSYPTV